MQSKRLTQVWGCRKAFFSKKPFFFAFTILTKAKKNHFPGKTRLFISPDPPETPY